MSDDRLLTAREVAERLGVTPSTIVAWASGDPPKLRGYRLGGTTRGRLRFRSSDVDAYLEQWATAPAPQEPRRRLEAV